MRNIFYVGLPKTGSVSLNVALESLGYKTIQDHAGFACPLVEAAERGETLDSIKPESGTAILDIGIHQVHVFKKLDELYPGSRFIAIRRPLDDWIKSILTHCLWSRTTGKGGWIETDTVGSSKIWKTYYDELLKYFADRDRDFLFMEIDQVGWEPLCKFLGRPIPQNTPYPNGHTGLEKITEICGGGFTTDWLSHNLPVWRKLFSGFVEGKEDRANLRILEIGSYEGRSTLWWLNNLLRSESFHLTCIDPWVRPEVEKRFDVNIALSGKSNQVKKLKGLSRNFVPWISDKSLDIAYIDGSHEGRDVILDGLMVLPKMKSGGIILFDDYKWENPEGMRHHLPEPAIDAFLKLCDDRVEVIHKGYQVAVKVKG